MKRRITALCIFVTLILLLNCNKPAEVTNDAPFKGVITFISGDIKINDKSTNVGSVVAKDDVITTGEKSIAVIQFAQTSIITMKSNTVLKINDLINTGANGKGNAVEEFSLVKGTAFSKVMVKGTDYSVQTPTMVAAVRGTAFQVQVNNGETRVDLLEGVLLITQNTGEVLTLTAGHYIVSTKDGLSKPGVISRKESEKLAVYNGIRPVPDLDKTVSGTENNTAELLPGIEVESGEIKKINDAVPGDNISGSSGGNTVTENSLNSGNIKSAGDTVTFKSDKEGDSRSSVNTVPGRTVKSGDKNTAGDKVSVNTGNKSVKKISGKVTNKTGKVTKDESRGSSVAGKTVKEGKNKTGGTTALDETGGGILSVIRLKDGKEYTGTFRQSGEFVDIIMPGKKIKVRALDIKDITRYRN